MESEKIVELNFNNVNEYSSKHQFENYLNIPENQNEENFSEIISEKKNTNFSLKKKFSYKLDFQIEDWRLNLMEINLTKGFLIFASYKSIHIMKFNRNKRTKEKIFGTKKTLLTLEGNINQIKLITVLQKKSFEYADYYDKENNIYYTDLKKSDKFSAESFYLCAVDMLGYLHVIYFEYNEITDTSKINFHKKYNCKIIHNDYSIWSIDCFFPYVIVGGNHRCIFLNDINSDVIQDQVEIRNNINLLGNKHNIPYVSFSPEGEFICSNSVDSMPKIWERDSGKLLSIIYSDLKEMGWSIKMIRKENFIYKKQKKTNVYKEDIKNKSLNYEDINQSNVSNVNLNEEIPETIGSLFDKYLNDLGVNEFNEDNDFSQEYIDQINSQNMKSEDKINEKDYEKIFFNNNIIKNNLEKYFVFSTFKSCMVIFSYKITINHENLENTNIKEKEEISNVTDDKNKNENIISENKTKLDENASKLNNELDFDKIKFQKICLRNGKINLLKDFLLIKFKDKPITHELKNIIFGYINSSRYEFIYFSNVFNLLIVGNRCGDFHLFKLKMKFKDNPSEKRNDLEENFLQFDEKPIFLISFTYKICGFKVIEFEDKSNYENSFLEIYFMDLQARLECYKLNYYKY